MGNVAKQNIRHVVFRTTWARAMARGVRSPAAGRPRGRRTLVPSAARSAARRPARGVPAGQPLVGAAPLPARAGPPRARGSPRRGGPLPRGARLPSLAPAPWAAAEPTGRREGLPEESGRARTRAPPAEPLRYRSGDDDRGRVVAANLSRGH